ncbi:MAG: XrtA/PEP-CTERM system histidine kinase PrsK, partial [Sphingomonadaceae bacterium]
PRSSFLLAALLGFAVALALVLGTVTNADMPGPAASAGTSAGPGLLLVVIRLVLAISGLVLLHNIHVASLGDRGPSIRFFCVGLGVLFAYDLNLYTLQFLLGQASPLLHELRGAVNALAVPLLFLAFRDSSSGRFALSRTAAFSTISFSAIGLYLIFMSLLAYGLRLAGGNWGVVLQVMFLAVTLIGGALIALSPRVRARLRVLIARNFYRYRYDYRTEWLRFLQKIDESGAGAQPIRERVIEAVATVLDSPGGALLEPDADGSFREIVRWNWPTLDLAALGDSLGPDSAIVQHMHATGRIIDFDQLRGGVAADSDSPEAGLACPDFALADRSLWLAVPLVHRARLIAILLLERSLVVPDLNWEDYDLLRTLGRQSASYLAEAATQMALDEARSFEEFNRRFAFVMHDLKNVVSQLALVSRNAERHMDKAEFREDLAATLAASVTKMTDLLALLGRQQKEARPPEAPGDEEVDLARLACMVAASLRRQHAAIDVEGADTPVLVTGDSGRLEAMLSHLVQNAIDASAPDAPITISLASTPRTARLVIADRGHGMSASFVRDELFRPFRSSKASGFGIGAYEAREIVRAHGGRMEVASRPGEGSRFTITLPLAAAARRKLQRV